MGFFDKFTGTVRPAQGTPVLSGAAVKDALLGLNGQDVPFLVREDPMRGIFVAELRIIEPAWATFFIKSQLSKALQIEMRLDGKAREVRSLDRMWDVQWIGETPRLVASTEYSSGQINTSSRRWEIGKSRDGKWERAEVFRFDSSAMKNALRDAVVQTGWTWRGVISAGKL